MVVGRVHACVGGSYLRMSVGIESEEDIIADLRQALEATRMELH